MIVTSLYSNRRRFPDVTLAAEYCGHVIESGRVLVLALDDKMTDEVERKQASQSCLEDRRC